MGDVATGKVCIVCKVWKPVEAFNRDRRKKSGMASECKACHNEKARQERRVTRVCTECRQRKPVGEFASKRVCIECKTHKVCKVCGERLHMDAFDGWHGLVCRTCRKRLDGERYQADRERVLARNAAWRAEHAQPDSPYRQRQKRLQTQRKKAIRAEVLAHYGGRCACCGETEPLFLTIDHMTMNGGEHRRQIKRFDIAYWLWLNDYPDGFQVLCFNCNSGRYLNGGRCPHEAARTALAQQDSK